MFPPHFLFVADYYPYGKILRKFVSVQAVEGDEKYQTAYHVERSEIPTFIEKRDQEMSYLREYQRSCVSCS